MSEEENSKELRAEYDVLGAKLLELGGTFRPISSFRNSNEAEIAIERLKSTIKAREKALAEMENQEDDDEGVIVETSTDDDKGEDEMSSVQASTNGAKKTVVKKASVKKAAAPKKAKGASKFGKFDPAGKIHILEKDNPRREGTKRHKWYETARKSTTVEAYVKAGGHIPSLKTCVDKGWIKVS
jgi:hypothetical protein